MAITDDGGPAFPGLSHQHRDSYGMSLRDYFAAKALMGICAGWSQSEHPSARDSWTPTEHVGIWAYRAADAMIEARKR